MTTIDALVVAAVGVGTELESQAIHRSQQEDSISVLSEQQEPVVAAFEEQETAVTEAVCRVWSKRGLGNVRRSDSHPLLAEGRDGNELLREG
jgi:hypothetical protein